MVAVEPAHLARLEKACPRPGCGSSNVKWRYYNNKMLSQPRYMCLACNELFTFGGKIRKSKEEKQRQSQAAATAAGVEVKKKARTKTTARQSSPSSTVRTEMERPLMMESPPKRRIDVRPKDHSVLRPASPISKGKKNMRILRLRLTSGTVMDLPLTSSDEESEGDAGAEMSSPAATHASECEERHGLELPESEMFDDASLEAGEGVLECDLWEAAGDGGSPFSWTSSEHLRGTIVRCAGSSESDLRDSEKESLLIDTGLSSLRSWEDVVA